MIKSSHGPNSEFLQESKPTYQSNIRAHLHVSIAIFLIFTISHRMSAFHTKTIASVLEPVAQQVRIFIYILHNIIFCQQYQIHQTRTWDIPWENFN